MTVYIVKEYYGNEIYNIYDSEEKAVRRVHELVEAYYEDGYSENNFVYEPYEVE